MRPFLSLPPSLAISCLLLSAAVLPFNAAAQILITDDYIYIGIEAEEHVSKDDRWVTTIPSTPTTENDPDGNHSDQAGGSTYLELLPDVRVTHEDTFGPPVAYWGRGGEGPSADYLVNFPQAGRYYVHVRAYSTGTEDNGLHIGLNDNWPASGQRMQFCSAAKRSWWWSSAQRDAGGNGSCGAEKTIWLDVPSEGVHTVSISAREDGFEIDRLALIKDLSGNTQVCSPTTLTGVNCRNGSIESADGFVDLRVILSAEEVGSDPEAEPPNPTEVVQGSNIELTAQIENLDAFDTANEIVLTLFPRPGDWNMIAMDQRCSEVRDEFVCTLDELEPTAPNENAPFIFTMQARLVGDLRIDAALRSDDIDESPSNDVGATVVRVLPGTAPVDVDTDLELTINAINEQYETGERMRLSVAIANTGSVNAENVSFSMTPPAAMIVDVQALPNDCSYDGTLECTFAVIEDTTVRAFNVDLSSDAAGIYSLSANIAASNDNNASNNMDSESVQILDSSVVTGSTDVVTDGMGEGNTTGTPVVEANDSKAGALAHWFLLVLVLLGLTRLYGWHQRELVAIVK